MTEIQNHKQYYDFEERTLDFAKQVRKFIKNIPRTIANIEDGKQLIRSSGSVGANYIEANEALSQKDFYHRVKISRKEAKESRFWLNLIFVGENITLEQDRRDLIQETMELTKIFGSIITKIKK